MADFDEWDTDAGDGQGVGPAGEDGGGAPVISGGLLNPRTFPVRQDPLTTYPTVESEAPVINGPLRTSVHNAVLNDILNAQAGLPQTKPRPETWRINGRTYNAISADTFDPSRSNGMTLMPTPAQDAAAWAGISQLATPSGDREQGGSILNLPIAPTATEVDPISGLVTQQRFWPTVLRTPRATAGGDDQSRTLTFDRVDGVSPLIHSHIDSGEYRSDGMVDEPSANGGLGDASSLLDPHPAPMATVSHGQVGWHVLDNGQLKFLYPQGAMTSFQIGDMQDKLNGQQRLLQRRK